MADLFNSQPILGIVILDEGAGDTIYNNQPVIGLQDAADALFVNNLRTIGVQVIDDGSTIYNDQPVRGAVVITDGRMLYNNRLVLPASGLGPSIVLSNNSISESASIGDDIGTLSVTNGSGSYTFAITDDPDAKFAVDGSNLNTAAALDFETAASHSVTISADNGVDSPLAKTFIVSVLNVIEDPINSAAPAVTGSLSVGSLLSCSTGSWSDMAAGGFTYQWKLAADDSDISGATSSTLLLTNALVGESVYCAVTATNIAGDATANSNTAGPVTAIAAPTVSAVSPADDAIGVATSTALTVTFDKTVQFGSGTISLKATSDDSTVDSWDVSTDQGAGAGQVELSGAVLTMHLTSALSESTGYYVVWDSGVVTDAFGTPVAAQSSTTAWNFTTGDFTAPTISSLSPADGASSFNGTSNLTVTFNEAVQFGDVVSITVHDASDDSVVQSFDAGDIGEAISISGAVLTIEQDALDPADYYVEISSGSIKDLAGNSFAGITNATSWNFTVPSGPSMPAGLVAWWSADSIIASNGDPVTSWVDSVNGIEAMQTTGGNQPILTANAQNGLPAVTFDGSNDYLTFANAAGDLTTAIDSQNYSVLAAFKAASGMGIWCPIFGTNALSGSNFYMYADGSASTFTSVGTYNSTNHLAFPDIESFTTYGIASSTPIEFTAGETLHYLNGGCLYVSPAAENPTAGNDFIIGGIPGSGFYFKGDIFEIVVFDTRLSPAEMKQAVAVINNKYGIANPWDSIDSPVVMFGDSITDGVGSNIGNGSTGSPILNYPSRLAAAMGLSYGQWDNFGVQGAGIGGPTGLAAAAPAWIDPLPAFFGKDVILCFFEWANENQGANPTDTIAFVLDRESAGGFKLVLGTSTMRQQDPDVTRDAYDLWWDANHGDYAVASYVPIHWDKQIGTQDAYANHGGVNSYDGLHLTSEGYAFLAADFIDGINSLLPPAISSFSPAQGSISASVSAALVVTFAVSVTLGSSGTITLKEFSDDSTVETWDVSTDSGSGAGKVEVASSNQLTLHLSSNLSAGTQYYVVWDEGVVVDAQSNGAKPKTTSTAWNFTTAS